MNECPGSYGSVYEGRREQGKRGTKSKTSENPGKHEHDQGREVPGKNHEFIQSIRP